MWSLAFVLAIAAATPRVPAAPAAADTAGRSAPSEQAMRHYLQGRWSEATGNSPDARAEMSRALSLDPQATEVMLRLSELAASSGEPGRSLELADRVLEREPDNARALWLRGAALFNLGRPAEALAPLEAAARLDSLNVEFVRTLARVAETTERLPLVLSAWDRATRLDDEDPESWFQLASVATRLGRYDLADSALDRCIELNPVRPGTLFLRGWIRENTGRQAEAIDLYRAHLEIHASDYPTRRRLVVLLSRSGRNAEAYREARRLSESRPEDPDALLVEAECAFASGKPAEGERALERLRALAPSDPELVLRSIGVLSRHDRSRTGVKIADAWALLRPSDPRGLSLSARARALAGDYDSAAVYARRLIAATPDSVDSHRLLARIHQDAKRWPEAIAAWRSARQLAPDDPLIMLDLGFCLEQSGDVAGAIAMGREAIKRAPDYPGALNFLGYLLADNSRDLEEALGLITRALEQDPGNGAYLDSYGWVLYRLGRLEEARKQLEGALTLTGGDPVVHEHLGDVYRDLRLLDQARQQYRASLDGDSRNARVRNKLEKLR